VRDTDHNYFSIADVDGATHRDLVLDPRREGHDAREFDDTLKLSHARNITILGLFVRGGSENAIDMNRGCAHVRIDHATVLGGDHCAVVIKGGSTDIALERITILNPSSAYDIELGGWSDQSMERTRRVVLAEVRRADFEPVRVVVGHADRPAIIGGRVRVLFWRSLALKAFWTVRFLANKWRNKQ